MAVGVLSYAGFTFADVVISDLQWPTWYHWLHGYASALRWRLRLWLSSLVSLKLKIKIRKRVLHPWT